jgi:hypothetical protein
MDTFKIVILIFWSIWLPWMGLFYTSVQLRALGKPKLNDFILKYLFYYSSYSRKIRQSKEEERIREHGTDEERTNLHNKHNPDYQILTESEVYDKYKGVDKEKIVITPMPCFLIDNRSNILYNANEEIELMKNQLDGGLPVTPPVIKDYVEQMSVRAYDKLDVDLINSSNKVFIFNQKSDNYRFITK